MLGAIAEAYYKEIPSFIKEKVMSLLDKDIIRVVDSFNSRYMKMNDRLTGFDRF